MIISNFWQNVRSIIGFSKIQLQMYQLIVPYGDALQIEPREGKFDLQHLQIHDINSIRRINLSHCGITSLKGIEQFNGLQEIIARGNDLRDISDIYRISKKEKIRLLDFRGNDIEYSRQAIFSKLIRDFPNLVEVNGKNYQYLLYGKKKTVTTRKIMARAKQVEKQFGKTIKRECAKRDSLKQILLADQEDFGNRRTQVDQKFERYDKINSKPAKTKRYSSVASNESSQDDCNEKYFDQQWNQSIIKQNIQGENENHVTLSEIDISLGNISNIPMTRSIKAPNAALRRKSNLQINVNQSSHSNHIPLTQPTATFALQRQREKENISTESGFAFRSGQQKYKKMYEAIEIAQESNDCNRSDFGRMTRKGQQGLLEEEEEDQYLADQQENPLATNRQNIENALMGMAQAFYYKKLQSKILFQMRRGLSSNYQMPLKKHF